MIINIENCHNFFFFKIYLCMYFQEKGQESDEKIWKRTNREKYPKIFLFFFFIFIMFIMQIVYTPILIVFQRNGKKMNIDGSEKVYPTLISCIMCMLSLHDLKEKKKREINVSLR